MRNEDAARISHSQCVGLGFCGILKFARGDTHRGNPLDLEPYRVMQTARGTGTSVREGLNYEVVIVFDFLTERLRSGFGKRWLRITVDRNVCQMFT